VVEHSDFIDALWVLKFDEEYYTTYLYLLLVYCLGSRGSDAQSLKFENFSLTIDDNDEVEEQDELAVPSVSFWEKKNQKAQCFFIPRLVYNEVIKHKAAVNATLKDGANIKNEKLFSFTHTGAWERMA
jgi:hypothetical protein